MESKTVYLALQNGMVFEGKSFGAEREAIGELVFTTAMVGYLETLTDPSYFGQILIQTFPLIGNYGVIPEDFESRQMALSAYIVREYCDFPSNFRSKGKIDDLLKKHNIPGMYGVNTRDLTCIVRENGSLGARLMHTRPTKEDFEALSSFKITDAVKSVTRKQEEILPAENEKKHRVVLMDFGAKQNIIRSLQHRGCEVVVLPGGSSYEEILARNPDGIMLSNGPGDPGENGFAIEQIKKLVESGLPIFGICLGHQLLALSQGAKAKKLKFGHRGANQPVYSKERGRVFITSQNHSYEICSDSLPAGAEITYYNCNDKSCEGISYSGFPAFGVQFHPEACAGPLDTGFIFDKFISMIKENKNAAE